MGRSESMRLSLIVTVSLVLAFGGTPGVAIAEEVRILAAGAVQKPVKQLIARFEADGRHKAIVIFDTVGALRDRVLAGEAAHVVMLSAPALDLLAAKGRIDVATRRALGRTGVGLAAHASAPAADITKREGLAAVLLAASSIGQADPARGATAGMHFRKVIGDLGLTEQLAARLRVLSFGGDVVAAVGRGEIAIGASQASEIVGQPNVRFLGFLPDELQLWTGYAAAEVVPVGAETAAAPTSGASDLLALLTSPDGRAAFAAAGFRD